MGSIAFLFPGQGSQSVGMLATLSDEFPIVRQTFVEASDGAGIDLWNLSQGGPEEMLNRTEYTQPTLLAAGIAIWRVWHSLAAPTPSHLSGHSLGEYTALVAAGALELGDAAHLVRIRGQAMQGSAPAGLGAMAAVIGAEDALVESICRQVSGDHVVVPANYNSPGQVVIGGHAVAVDAAIAKLAESGVRKVVKLAVSVPSHTPLMREAANRLAEAMGAYEWREPQIPVMQNVDARVHATVADIRAALVRQLYLPVQWTGCVQALVGAGVTRMAECGPGKVLAGLVRRIDRGIDMHALGTPAELETAREAWS
jgi:[acyl-carrier-protein] S-malonyltransferase